MSTDALQIVLKEMQRRKGNAFVLDEYCFDEQIKFIRDPARFKTAVCSRRSGKTIACAAHLLETALNTPNIVCLYITSSKGSAKKIIWPDLLKINQEYKLGAKANETESFLKFRNGSVIYLSGANDKSEIDKFRGLALKLVYIDEAQSFRPYLEELVNEVLSKTLFDYNGTLCMIGTPGPVPVGYFYNCSHEAGDSAQGWSQHGWTMFNNPHLTRKSGRSVQELIADDMTRMGVTLDDPRIQRECYGRWVTDPNSLVFRYNKELNHYDSIPVQSGFKYILGIDLGFDDADAIAVIGWREGETKAYLIEEHVETKQGISELASKVDTLIKKYSPLKCVIDTGGLGKKIAEEMRRRYSLPITAAEKTRKFEYIELLNDAMRTTRFMARSNSRFAQDCMLVEWDKESSQLKISDRFHSDIADAVLYAFRESLHWLETPEPPKPDPKSKEWVKAEQERLIDEHLERIKRQKSDMDNSDNLGWNDW